MDLRLCYALLLFFTWTSLPLCWAEIYTSLVNVKHAISAERKLIDSLKSYIEQESDRLQDIRRFYAKVSHLHSDVYKGQATALANPLLAFTLIKRLYSEWANVVYSDEALENSQALRSSYEEEESALPKLEDLQGAVRGLLRLQDVYSLQVSGLVRGHFLTTTSKGTSEIYRPLVSVRLSGDDCFLVGKVAYDQEDYYHSVPWLEQSVRLFRGHKWSPENQGTLEDALDHLAFSHFKTGNVTCALSLSQELLHHDPVNERVLQNVEKYEKMLVVKPHIKANELRRPASKYLRTREVYERLCQNHGSHDLHKPDTFLAWRRSRPACLHGHVLSVPTHFQNPRLFCDYFTSGSPGLIVHPAKREILSLQPFVVLYHDFITHTEAEDVKRLAQPGLKRSVIASGEKQATADYRISKSAWLKDSSHAVIGKLDHRISMVTGLNVNHPFGEYLQVVNYGIGGHYEPHFDHATAPTSPVYKLNTGNRVATFMIYLSSVDAGGSTAFIYANFSLPVVEKAAIFWWNLHRNGEGDVDTLHAGCPVLVGDKWVANKWIHEYGQEFTHRCTLNPDE